MYSWQGWKLKVSLVLRVELGLSHLPWSKCIDGTREMENLKINICISINLVVFDFFLVDQDPPGRFKTQGAVGIHQATSDKIGLHSFIMHS
jgi:hypothetical protein